MSKKIALITLFLILILVNWSIYSKEVHLKEGKTVYLALAPVDPRSLMQGDYMALRFTLARDIYKALPKVHTPHRRDTISYTDGKVIVSLDKENKGTFKALYNTQTLNNNEILLHYRVRNNKVKLASNAFFFQEGTAKVYEKAKYGEFKVKDGELLLTNMYDTHLQKLIPRQE
jgi:uncharacterized membrane-anchored protein